MSLVIKMQADDFFNAYRVLRESDKTMMDKLADLNGKPLLSSTALGSFSTGSAGVVCLAFSVELYIKDLHFIVNGEVPRGHNILELFRMLPKGIQEEIRNYFSIQNVINFYSMQKFSLYTPTDKSKRPITDALELKIYSISEAFEKWRYSYESMFPDSDKGNSLKYDIGFALAFIEAVKSVADSKRELSTNL